MNKIPLRHFDLINKIMEKGVYKQCGSDGIQWSDSKVLFKKSILISNCQLSFFTFLKDK